MRQSFELGQTYIRRMPLPAPRLLNGRAIIKEVGRVREASSGLIVMDIDGPLPGRETFNPAIDTGWRPRY